MCVCSSTVELGMRVQSGDSNTQGTQADAREKSEEGQASVKSDRQVGSVFWIQKRNVQPLKHTSQVYPRVSGPEMKHTFPGLSQDIGLAAQRTIPQWKWRHCGH